MICGICHRVKLHCEEEPFVKVDLTGLKLIAVEDSDFEHVCRLKIEGCKNEKEH